MFQYVFSIVLIVASNTFYNIFQKSTPARVNPFAALLITYLTAALLSFFGLFLWRTEGSLTASFRSLNWTSIALGFAIVGLELGYLLAYRAGWNISVGTLVANLSLAAVLIPVGIFLYREQMSPNKLIGLILCAAGLFFINRK